MVIPMVFKNATMTRKIIALDDGEAAFFSSDGSTGDVVISDVFIEMYSNLDVAAIHNYHNSNS
jgi:hypothetical protein